jgi:co-chaperonin GroES (HSP10)
MPTIKPFKDYILVGENKRETKTASGIIIEGAQGMGDSRSATVLEIGPDVKNVAVGDKVYLIWGTAQVVVVDQVQRLLVKEENVVGRLEE